MMAFSRIAAVFLCCFLTCHVTCVIITTRPWWDRREEGPEGARFEGCYSKPSLTIFTSHEKRGEPLQVGDCTDFCKKKGSKYVALTNWRRDTICRCLKNNVHLRQLKRLKASDCTQMCVNSKLPCGGLYGRANIYAIVKKTPRILKKSSRPRRIRIRLGVKSPYVQRRIIRYRPRHRPRPRYIIWHRRRGYARGMRSRQRRQHLEMLRRLELRWRRRRRLRPSPLLKLRVQKVTRARPAVHKRRPSIRKPPPRRKPIPKPKIVAVEVERKPGSKPKVVSVDVVKPKPKKKAIAVKVEPKPVTKPKVVTIQVRPKKTTKPKAAGKTDEDEGNGEEEEDEEKEGDEDEDDDEEEEEEEKK